MTRHTSLPALTLLALALAACGPAEGAPGLPSAKSAAPPVLPEREADPPQLAPAGAPSAAPASGEARFVATVLPRESAELGPKMSGSLAAITVAEGDQVKKGQLLFRVNPGTMRLQVDSAEAGLAGAQLARDEAQRELDRQQKLVAKGTVGAVNVERAQANYDAAVNAVERAEVGVSLSKRALTDAAVVSPINGVVAAKLKNVGETVTMMPPTIVLIVQDQSALEVRVRVPENRLRALRPGGALTVHFTALGLAREAVIKRVQPTIDPITRTVEIVAEVDNSDDMLRPGMYAEVVVGAEAPKTANEVQP
jgi:RND family efflux transporter MFP subunit